MVKTKGYDGVQAGVNPKKLSILKYLLEFEGMTPKSSVIVD